jgi:hypothetical protein
MERNLWLQIYVVHALLCLWNFESYFPAFIQIYINLNLC